MLIGDYCAYRERCHSEVRTRLFDYGMTPSEADELMMELITGDFLNEERFARAFARGKFLHNKWGKRKIVSHLKKKSISEVCIKLGLQEIDEEAYTKLLHVLLERKSGELKIKNQFTKNRKVADYLIRKGFESERVWDILRKG